MSASTMDLPLEFVYGAFKSKITLAEAVDLFIVSDQLYWSCTCSACAS